ncbi:INACTIVE RECEPTOR KINASE-RELATED [Salix viminalis]|uniref:INACTIVE RECEPTOR KINASE-RELATED n=1 Tax=Salix viminalis TaxID=40686 RepID=A0A9Q0TAV3_SALVM|nr:INACTIVE RECEPTOR KINASE-RELATED [Salix viminalis]
MKPRPTLLVSIAFFVFLSLNSLSTVESDLASERAALITLRDAVGGRSLLWNLSENPCQWMGVFCDQKNSTVVYLKLPGKGFSGHLPVALGNLTSLQTLSLRFNALSGPIPADIGDIISLRNLFLQGNFFSGEIPEFLFKLKNLVRLNLANNNFSGVISPSFNNLTRLDTLYLEGNQLTGSIPDLNLPLDQFNVSLNNLTGPIPQKLSTKPASAFQGTLLCGVPLASCNGTSNGDSGGGGGGGGGGDKLSGLANAGIVIGCVIAFLLIVLILIFLRRRKRERKEAGSKGVEQPREREAEIPGEKAAGRSGNVRAGQTGADLLKASAEVLGKGTFGTAYKAALDVGLVVAVKRLKDVTVPEKEFREKIERVGNMNHENLVPLRAYYYSRDEKLLVHDYMPMGSLSALLHGNKGSGRTPLNWETRSGIALGAARGIAYIHSQGPANSHGNIKSSNILLTTSFEARVSDFGLAQLAGPTPTPNRIDGYRAPEVTDARKVSQKADVYSFGILLLELLTGKAPTHTQLNDEGVDLPRWVQSVVREEWSAEVFDSELLRYQTVEEDMVQLLQLATDCTAQYPDNRPSMSKVRSLMEDLCRSSSQEHDIYDDKSS